MRRALVFGAGASVSLGVPTMDRFIDAAEDLLNTPGSGVTQAHFELVFDVLRNRFRQLQAKSTVNLDNIEAVFGLVEMAKILGLPGFASNQIDDLAVAIRTVLAETVQQSGRFTYTDEQVWKPPAAYSTIAQHIERQRRNENGDVLSIITFNYDLGIDFALHWSNLQINYGLASAHARAVPLFKLHGSLNWVSCKVCHEIRAIPMESIFRAHQGMRDMRSSSIQVPLDARRAHSQVGPHCPGDNAPYEIALIPPSWNKTQYWKQLSPVWSAAARALAEAQEITIVGYSLPDSDSFFRDLLALGLEGPTRVRSFQVVNPDESVAPRFERLLGNEVRARFRTIPSTFENWVREAFSRTGPIVA